MSSFGVPAPAAAAPPPPPPTTQTVLLCLQLYHFTLYGVDPTLYPPPYCLQGVLHQQTFSSLWEQEEGTAKSQATAAAPPPHSRDPHASSSRCNARWRRSETLVTAMTTLEIPSNALPMRCRRRGSAASLSRGGGGASTVPLQQRLEDEEDVRELLTWWRSAAAGEREREREMHAHTSYRPPPGHDRSGGLEGAGVAVEVYSYGAGESPVSTLVGGVKIRLETLLACPHGSRIRLTLTRPAEGEDRRGGVVEQEGTETNPFASVAVGEVYCSFRAALRAPLGLRLSHVHMSPNPLAVLRPVPPPGSGRGAASPLNGFPPSTLALDVACADPALLWASPAAKKRRAAMLSSSRSCEPHRASGDHGEGWEAGDEWIVSSRSSSSDSGSSSLSDPHRREETEQGDGVEPRYATGQARPFLVSVDSQQQQQPAVWSVDPVAVVERAPAPLRPHTPLAYPRCYPKVLTARRVLWSYAKLPVSLPGVDREWQFPFCIADGGFAPGTVLCCGAVYQQAVSPAAASSAPAVLFPVGSFNLVWPPAQYRFVEAEAEAEAEAGAGGVVQSVLLDAIFTPTLCPSVHVLEPPFVPGGGDTDRHTIQITVQARLRIPAVEKGGRETIRRLMDAAVAGGLAGPQPQESATGGGAPLTLPLSTASGLGDGDGARHVSSSVAAHLMEPSPATLQLGSASSRSSPSQRHTPQQKRYLNAGPAAVDEGAALFLTPLRSTAAADMDGGHSPAPRRASAAPVPTSTSTGGTSTTGAASVFCRSLKEPHGTTLSVTPTPSMRRAASSSCGPSYHPPRSVLHLTALEQQQRERIDRIFMARLLAVRGAKAAVLAELQQLRGSGEGSNNNNNNINSTSPATWWGEQLPAVAAAQSEVAVLREELAKARDKLEAEMNSLHAVESAEEVAQREVAEVGGRLRLEEERRRTAQRETRHLAAKLDALQKEMTAFMGNELQRYALRLQEHKVNNE